MKKFECTNKVCPLGTVIPVWTPGQFTGGMTEQNRDTMGLPADHPVGEGICPNCGQKGKAI
jgi:hypothetical protein